MKKNLLMLFAAASAGMLMHESFAKNGNMEKIPLTILAPDRAQFEYDDQTIKIDFPGVKPADTAKIFAIKKMGDENVAVGTLVHKRENLGSYYNEVINFFALIFDKDWKLAAKPTITENIDRVEDVQDSWIGIEGNKILTLVVKPSRGYDIVDFIEYDLGGKLINFVPQSLDERLNPPSSNMSIAQIEEYERAVDEREKVKTKIEKIASVKVKKEKVIAKLNVTKEGKAGTRTAEFEIK